MLHAIDDLVFAAPFGFHTETTTLCLRVPAEDGVHDAAAAAPLRPSIVVHRRPAAAGASLAACVADVVRELSDSVSGIAAIEQEDLQFGDGAAGTVLAYGFPATGELPGVRVAQLQALRLDGSTLTSLTFTTTAADLSGERRRVVLKAFASARPALPEPDLDLDSRS